MAELIRDSFGVVNAVRDSESERSNGSTETGSSIPELTRAMDTGLRSSFRAITGRSEGRANDDHHYEETEVKVKTADVHVHTTHAEAETPDSVASTGRRTFFTNGGIKQFSVSELQQNHLAKSMRDNLKAFNHNEREFDNIFPAVPNYTSATDHEEKAEKKVLCWPKVVGICIVAALLVAGLTVLLYFKKEANPDGQKGIILEDPETGGVKIPDACGVAEIKLRETIQFSCDIDKLKIDPDVIKYFNLTPPVYFNEGRNVTVAIADKTPGTDWNALISGNVLDVKGPAATCSTSGKYSLNFLDNKNASVANTSLNILVKSEVMKVNVSLNSTDSEYKLGCSTNSGCEQSFVDFFAEINQEEQFLRGVNFSCIITYNDYDGYSVNCIGNIPDFLLSQFEKITCRPRSRLLDNLDKEELQDLEVEIELPECDLTKHCGYKCHDVGDYYVVSEARCDIFHRCYEMQVFTSYCAPGTFFDPTKCACRHTRELLWCQDNGAIKKGADINKEKCISS